MLLTTLLVLMLTGFVYRRRSGKCTSRRSLRGRTAIVTGASSGIGKETARDLARRGARVILACRNLMKAQMVADEIMRSTGNKEVVARLVDTADLQSVREFAREILGTERAIHVLVNNAGIVGPEKRQVTRDGLELTMATNHYGHFLLTNLLLKRLKQSAPSRVINVASAAHMFTMNIDPRDLNYEKKSYGTMSAYAQSKLCNILFTFELAQKLRGSGVTTNTLHPGAVSTEFFVKDKASRSWLLRALTQALNFLVKVVGKDSVLGAQTTIYLSVAEDVEDVSGGCLLIAGERPHTGKDPLGGQRN
ncbi:retinol dehydrogenase 13-like isoform X2 [Panulirus ornatus]|uniref:retinol dehydrogenase 13-like isoform X2 n=1 Tax=Panulirus ornatus TaxID=150431 RepID=UPI003A87BFA8